MAVAFDQFHDSDDAKWKREVDVFRRCSDKTGKILRWTLKNEDSIEELRAMALSQGGLFNASIRQKAWRELLGIRESDLTVLEEAICGPDMEELDLIRKDVKRSAMFRSKAVAGSIVKGQHDSQSLERKLTSMLMTTISSGAGNATGTKEKPCYYQGLHDVAFVFLQNFNYDDVAATAAFQKVVQTHLKDATRKDFSNVTAVLDSFLLPLIHSLDIQLYQALVESEVPLSNAILPWLITLFTHSVQDYAVASRLMDAFIAHQHPMLPFYVAVALLLHPTFREQLLESSLDPVMMQMAIQSLPGQMKNDFVEGDVTAQDIIESALEIMRHNPPESLLGFVGAGLKKRSRRRLLKKMCGISMLQIPVNHQGWLGFDILSKSFLPKRLVPSMQLAMSNAGTFISSAARDAYDTAASAITDKRYSKSFDCSKAIDLSKACLMALQTIVLFVLMPRLHVEKFYCLMQGFLGWMCSSMSLSEESEISSNLRQAMKLSKLELDDDEEELAISSPGQSMKLSKLGLDDDYDEELAIHPPRMVRADSTLSLSEMNFDTSDAPDWSCDLDKSLSEWSEEGALVI